MWKGKWLCILPDLLDCILKVFDIVFDTFNFYYTGYTYQLLKVGKQDIKDHVSLYLYASLGFLLNGIHHYSICFCS